VSGTRVRRLRLGRLHVDDLTFEGALDAVVRLVEGGQGGTVFTPNVDHVVLAEHDERFRRAYEATRLSLADGMPVVWAARRLGLPGLQKISGSDLVLPLVERVAARGLGVFLCGGAPGVAEEVARRLRARFPALRVVGVASPSIDMAGPAEARQALVAEIRATRPDLVLVALGSPKGELFAHEASPSLAPALVIGVGASFDFIAGTARRAPGWMSAWGLEWLFRLAHEPGRLWRRYLLRDPQFLAILWRTWRAKGTSPRDEADAGGPVDSRRATR